MDKVLRMILLSLCVLSTQVKADDFTISNDTNDPFWVGFVYGSKHYGDLNSIPGRGKKKTLTMPPFSFLNRRYLYVESRPYINPNVNGEKVIMTPNSKLVPIGTTSSGFAEKKTARIFELRNVSHSQIGGGGLTAFWDVKVE